jgi:hypothetical protein
MQPTPQDNQLMLKHRVLSFKPHLRLEWRGQDGQNETEQPDRSASLCDSIASSTRIRFLVHTGGAEKSRPYRDHRPIFLVAVAKAVPDPSKHYLSRYDGLT